MQTIRIYALFIVLFASVAIAAKPPAEKVRTTVPSHPVPTATNRVARAKPAATATAPLSASAKTMVDRLRLSALIGDGPKMLIGVVDASTSNAFLLHLGDSVYGYEVVAANYKDETITLRLKEDTNAVPTMVTGEPIAGALPTSRKIKTLEEFLAEHPNATTPADVKFEFPTNNLPVRTFEDFIKEHPEMNGVSNYVAGGTGPDIEAARPPEITTDVSTPDPGQYGLGPGIEKALMELPADQRPKMEDLAPGKVKTYEEFIKENEWRFKQQNGSQPSATPTPEMK